MRITFVRSWIILVFLVAVFWAAPKGVLAVSNINPNEPEHWAWNDVIGWIDFCVPASGLCTLNVNVTDTKIQGYASSSVGAIAFDCATSPAPPPPNCTGQAGNWGVVNTVSQIPGQSSLLSGWAWNDAIGWISFSSDDTGTCVQSNPVSCYGVSIDTAGADIGKFRGWAWSDVVGWISFNCDHSADQPPNTVQYGNTCAVQPGGIDYWVRTGWFPGPQAPEGKVLTSSVFDTGVSGGAALNSILWQGDPLPVGAQVQFQIASSNCPGGETDQECNNGGWSDGTLPGGCLTDYLFPGINSCYVGPDGTVSTHYEGDPNAPIKLNPAHHHNKRYLRYRIFLTASSPPTPQSPVVRDVIINWSP